MIIGSLFLTAVALSELSEQEIGTEARFCLSLPAHPEAFEDLLHLRERRGWEQVAASQGQWNEDRYEIRTYRKGDSSVSTAFSSKRGRAFCQFSVSVQGDQVDAAIATVRKLYLTRAAVMTINPYEFATGVGEKVHVETVKQTTEEALLQFTVSTAQANSPF